MKTTRTWMALPLAAALVACGSSPATGTVTVQLTDAPGDFVHAVVTITEIDLVGSDGTTRLLTDRSITTDLLTLANDTATLVKDVEVPVGSYSQLRFVISGGYVEVAQPGGGTIIYASSPTYVGLPEGATVGGTLQMPSYAQSGLKVNLPAGSGEVATGANVLLVDFDVRQSFGQQAGNSGMWVMHPVVTATRFELSGTVVVTLAAIQGLSLPSTTALGDFRAVLTNAGGSAKTLPFTQTAGTWSATFPYLIPGDFQLDLVTDAFASFTTDPVVPRSVTVLSGQPTQVNLLLTSVAAPGGTVAAKR